MKRTVINYVTYLIILFWKISMSQSMIRVLLFFPSRTSELEIHQTHITISMRSDFLRPSLTQSVNYSVQ